MVKVYIPGPYRKDVGGKEVLEFDGRTLGQIFENLCSQYPDFGKKLFKEEKGKKKLNRSVAVYIGTEDHRYLNGMDTVVNERSDIHLVPAIAGG